MSGPRASQLGNTLVGFILGLVLGLAVAVAVALYVTKAPIPFINRLGHAPDAPPPDAGKLPDPNRSLYMKEGTPGSEGVPVAPAAAIPAGPVVAPAVAAEAAGKGNPGEKTATTALADAKQSYLQAGAFKSVDDAQNTKGRLALLGFEAAVSSADKDGATVYRVRLGPYNRAEDMDRVRQRLSENGVEAVVVAAGK